MRWWLPVTKTLNRLGVPYPALNFTVSYCLSVVVEIKFEVTDRCNLACSFCHQDFAQRAAREPWTGKSTTASWRRQNAHAFLPSDSPAENR